jgi:hypothetical protein
MPDSKGEEELVIPENEPMPIIEGQPSRQRGEARWLHVLLYVITSLIFAFFLVLGGRWLYHKTHHSSPKNPAPSSNKVPSAPQTTKKPSTQKQQANNSTKSNSSIGNQPSNSGSQQSQNAPQQTTNSLPNNGPGNIVAVFLTVTAGVAALHYVYSSRKSTL